MRHTEGVLLSNANQEEFSLAASVVFWLIVLLFIASRLWALTDYSLWGDEIFSLRVARLGWAGLIPTVIGDIVHPPLHYFLLKLWIEVGGESLLWLRIFPVLISVATLFPFYALCRALRLPASVTNLAMYLMAVNGYLIFYSQELRMYSLLLFFTLCSLWLFVEYFKNESNESKRLVALTLVNLLLVYTHYYGWMVVGLEFIYLLGWQRRKVMRFAASCAALVLCYAPWVYVAARRAMSVGGLGPNLNWIDRPDWRDVASYFAGLNGPYRSHLRISTVKTLGGFLLLGAPVLFWIGSTLSKRLTQRGKQESNGDASLQWFLGIFSFLPIVFCFAFSQILPQSVWLKRCLIIAAVPYLILAAVAVHRLFPRTLRIAVVLLITGWAAWGGYEESTNRDQVSWEPMVTQMVKAEPLRDHGIKVYCLERSTRLPVAFYVESAHDDRFQVELIRDISDVDKVGEEKLFWIAFQEAFWAKRRQSPAEYLADRGYQIGDRFESGLEGHKGVLLRVTKIQNARVNKQIPSFLPSYYKDSRAIRVAGWRS